MEKCVAASSQWRMARAAWCTGHPRGWIEKDYTRHPQKEDAPHPPWQRLLEAASGAVGGCGGCGVARGDGRFAVHNLWVLAFIWAYLWEVSVFISMSPLYMRLQVVGKWPEILLKYFWGNMLHAMLVWIFSLRWFEYHSISVQVDSLKPTFTLHESAIFTFQRHAPHIFVSRLSKSRWPESAITSTWELHCWCLAATLRCFSILARELSIACDMHAKTVETIWNTRRI